MTALVTPLSCRNVTDFSRQKLFVGLLSRERSDQTIKTFPSEKQQSRMPHLWQSRVASIAHFRLFVQIKKKMWNMRPSGKEEKEGMPFVCEDTWYSPS